jgi:hypothetical protein
MRCFNSVICNESISAVTLSHAMCTIKARILILVRITSLTPPQLYQAMKVSGHVYVFYRYRFCYSFSDFFFSILELNVRENRRGNHEEAIQRNWQHWAHKTKDKHKQEKPRHRKLKMCNTDPP